MFSKKDFAFDVTKTTTDEGFSIKIAAGSFWWYFAALAVLVILIRACR